MTEIRAILEQLRRLGARERRLLLGRGLLQGAIAAVGALVVAAVLLTLGVDREFALAAVGGGGGLAVLAAGAWPVLRHWRAAGDPRAQARHLENLEPAFRGRLATAVDHAALLDTSARVRGDGAGAVRAISLPLLARAAGKAWEEMHRIPVARVHPFRPVARAAGGLLMVVLVAVIAGGLLPVGPLDALRVLIVGESAATARMTDAGAELREQRALVGDITLRYLFPDYTGIDPIEVPNSDGTIHAPPGTTVQITARTAEPFDAAGLEVLDAQGKGGPVQDARLEGGRDIRTQLVVKADGTWRFVLFRGRTVARSADFQIEAEADAPPVVTLESTPTGDAAVDRPLGIGWKAHDDYGLKRVVLEVELNGKVTAHELRAPLDVPRTLQGGVRATPRELGLKPGQDAKIRVVAYDNDLLGGSKRAASPELDVHVTGPRGTGAGMVRYRRELRDALLDALADFVVDPSPPGRSPRPVTRWVTMARHRLDPVQRIMKKQWGDEKPEGIDGVLVGEVMETAARLFRFAVTTFDPSSNRRITDRDLDTFRKLHGDEVKAIETAAYTLDLMLRQVALAKVAEKAEQVSTEARELAALAQGKPDPAELLARLDELDRLTRELLALAKQLSEGSLRAFTNSRVSDARNLMAEIRRAIAENRLDDARRMMEELADQLAQVSEGIEDQLAQREKSNSDLLDLYEKVTSELQQLGEDQKKLADDLAKAREQEGDEVRRMVDLWTRIEELADRVRDDGEGAVEAVGDARGWRADSVRRLGRFAKEANGVRDAVRARDASGALDRADGASLPLLMARRAVIHEGVRARPAGQTAPPGVADAAGKLADAGTALHRLRELLQRLQQQSERGESPHMQELARQLTERQSELRDREKALQPKVQKLENAMPTGDGSADQAMEQAGSAMKRSEELLSQGRSMAGEGNARAAAHQVDEARRRLEQQMQAFQQMQRAVGQMQGRGERESGGQDGRRDGNGNRDLSEQVEIPAPEAFRTPEAYRRALLRGMQGSVPKEYEALKKRYYEELVRQ